MLPELEQLLILQDKDQHIRRLKLDLKRLPAEQERANGKLAGDTEAVRAAKERVQLNEVAIKNLELQIQTRRDTIAKLKVQQFETRKNDEYTALGHEVERYTKDVTSLEDDELVLMEKAEGLKADFSERQKDLAATQTRVNEELQKITERQKNVTAQLAEFEGVRKGLAEKTDPDLLERYDRIFNHRGDAAIVELQAGICRGCHMKVTPACISAAKADKTLVTCSNCGRFVYLAE
ncbi:MAG TPA: C4-type zinc ribbon domain-containing protein [Verrucomicrobiales bacterium]|nr:C4-type zinc ribbon domain-containing protein [Verrucomicrobiales bacterium]